MASSGLVAYNPNTASFVDEAFERCGIPPSRISLEHIVSARRSMNLLLSDWANDGQKEWLIDTQTQALTQGTESYNCPAGTMEIIAAVISRSGVDTPLIPIDRAEYRLIPNKTQQGLPTRMLFHREATLQHYVLWQVPENSTDTLVYDRLRREDDVVTANENVLLPYNWFEAFASGLAKHLSRKFAPDRYAMLKQDAADAFKRANDNEREEVDLELTVSLRRN